MHAVSVFQTRSTKSPPTDGDIRLLFAEVDFGYGDLTAVYGYDGKKLCGFVYRDQIDIPREMTDKDGSTLKAWQFLQYPLLPLN